MDYIREELLRQRTAWAALLRSGQRAEAETLTEREAREDRVREAAVENGRTYAMPAAEMEATTTAAQRRSGQMRRTGTARRRGDVTAAEMAAGWSRTVASGGSDLAVMTFLRPERRQEQGAKELSRVIQRDSRRYDGGFVLY